MRSVFIAGAYSTGGGEQVAINVRNAMAAWHELEKLGYAPVCPHLSHFLHIHEPRPREVWLRQGLYWAVNTDCVLRLPGESEGADAECELVHSRGIPVFYYVADLVAFWQSQPEV